MIGNGKIAGDREIFLLKGITVLTVKENVGTLRRTKK